jgi:hypothetical protein
MAPVLLADAVRGPYPSVLCTRVWPPYFSLTQVRGTPRCTAVHLGTHVLCRIGASRVALRATHRMTVRGRRQGKRARRCDRPCRALPAIVQTKTKTKRTSSIEQCGGSTWYKSCVVNSGSRVALTVERTVRICMPLHRVPWRLCVCRVLSVIVDGNEERWAQRSAVSCAASLGSSLSRESVLFIGTQFSILYTFMYSPA